MSHEIDNRELDNYLTREPENDDEDENDFKEIKCGACGHIGIIVGAFASECEICGASVNPDTGEPFKDKDGKVVYCGQFNGRD